MIKNLVKHGNSWALVIDRPILELLKIKPDDPLEMTTDGTGIFISPVSSSDHKSKVREARHAVNMRHQGAFKKLAE